MNGHRRFGVSALAALAASALALGVGLALAPVGSPAPRPLRVHSGVPGTRSRVFRRPRSAPSRSTAPPTSSPFEWLEQVGVLAPGAVAIDIEVCDSAGSCLDPRDPRRSGAVRRRTGSLTGHRRADRRRRKRGDRLARRPDVVRRGGRVSPRRGSDAASGSPRASRASPSGPWYSPSSVERGDRARRVARLT